MRLPTASSLDRAFACPASHFLPKAAPRAGAAALRGEDIHSFIEVAREHRDEALAAIPDGDLRRELASIDVASIPSGAESEVPLGYDAAQSETTRYTLVERRAYPDDGLWHATLDLVGVTEHGVWVADIKTGEPTVSAADSWQLRLGALAAARLAGEPTAHAEFWFLRGDRWHRDAVEWGPWDLERFDAELLGLESLLTSLIGRDPGTLDVHPGDHCKYCPALLRCPAHTTHIVAALRDTGVTIDQMAALTPEQLGQMWPRLKRLQKDVEALLDAYEVLHAQVGPIPLEDGRRLDLRSNGDNPKFHESAAEWILEHWGPTALARLCAPQAKRLLDNQKEELERAGMLEYIPKKKSLMPMGSIKPKSLRAAKEEVPA